jgi:hypothetical protein
MKNNKIDKDILVVLVWTLVTVSAWVGFEIYRVVYTGRVEVKEKVETEIKDINPTLNLGVLDELEKRTL